MRLIIIAVLWFGGFGGIGACLAGIVGVSQQAEGEYGVDVRCLLDPVVKLSGDPVIVAQVIHYNTTPHPKPQSLDASWPSLGPDSSILNAVLNNVASGILDRFIGLVSLRGEGMLIGRDGGLVAATNHTTDFWQGDEAQFSLVMEGDSNQPQILAASLDASTQRVLIKIATAIVDDRGDKIGVLVVGFDALVMEYRQLCNTASQ